MKYNDGKALIWVERFLMINLPQCKRLSETLHTIIGGRTVLPLRFLAEYAGYEVMWDPAEEKVTLLWEKD